jgi:hypothetical protein
MDNDIKMHVGAEVQLHSFFTSVLLQMTGQLHVPSALSPGDNVA